MCCYLTGEAVRAQSAECVQQFRGTILHTRDQLSANAHVLGKSVNNRK